ncbi:uncharacterized protein [Physcomitrium patens]|uniref:uncharacterized protein isoform X2 n=1 Tax=Physcomitrium patens TaxID=3218 RepID=UPI000D1660F1|nr:uncharacterized protein LOC112292196 isoform X2 [Physcomitrium patens]|eukprot:XP_024396219.1 uncharacterized protein LOC112292196 isoform X2 [Physcomitrella patens]
MKSEKNPLEMEGLCEKKVKMVVHLHPSRASNVRQGVREILNSLLLRFNEHFEGSVLAHSDTKIQGRTAIILEGLTPYFCVRLTTTLLLFSPKVGIFVEGKVNKVEEDYLGVDGTRAWMNENDERHCIKIGSSIRFSVKSFQENEEIVDLTGALLGPQTGCVEWLALQSEEKHEAESTQMLLENGVKKSKHKESRSAEVDAEVSEGISEHTPKKKKKRKEKTVTGDHSSVKKRRKSLDVSAL